MHPILQWVLGRKTKWPASITIIRHGESEFNALKSKKTKSALYKEFLKFFEEDYDSVVSKIKAEAAMIEVSLNVGDHATPLTAEGMRQARITGENLHGHIPKPDIILCSPYLRTRQTLEGLTLGMGLQGIKVTWERRVREQEHGLSLLYNDGKFFQTFHPEQKLLKDLELPYWYRYPQGESVPDVQDRIQSVTDTLIREYAGKHVLIIAHHITMLAIRANFERMSPEQYLELDENEKPVNCGVTMYQCNPNLGKRGKLELVFYNKKFY